MDRSKLNVNLKHYLVTSLIVIVTLAAIHAAKFVTDPSPYWQIRWANYWMQRDLSSFRAEVARQARHGHLARGDADRLLSLTTAAELQLAHFRAAVRGAGTIDDHNGIDLLEREQDLIHSVGSIKSMGIEKLPPGAPLPQLRNSYEKCESHLRATLWTFGGLYGGFAR